MNRLVLACALVALLAACSSAGDGATGGAGGDTESAVTLDCEEQGYPCSWAEAGQEPFDRSTELLSEAQARLDAGDGPADVAAYLAGQPDVVGTNDDPTGVLFRVEGGLPVVLHTPLASPLVNALDDLAAAGEVPVVGSTPEAAANEPPGVVAAAEYQPTRRAGIRPRKALVIRPWAATDRDELEAGLRAGPDPVLGPGQHLDTDAFLRLVGNTEAALREASRHVPMDVRVDGSLQGFYDMWDYDITVIETHSSRFDCDAEHPVCGHTLGGPLVERADAASFAYQRLKGVPEGVTIGRIHSQWRFVFMSDYFKRMYAEHPGGDRIVIINACSSGHGTVSGLAGLMGVSAGAVYAWTTAIDALKADQSTAALAALLADNGVDTATAMAELRRTGNDRHTVGEGARPDHPQLVLLSRGDAAPRVRARDVITTLVDGAELEPGDFLSVAGEPEDGRDDRLRRVALRIDGVLAGDEDEATITWQFEGRNPEPVRVTEKLSDAREIRAYDGGWRDLELELTDVDLGFDLQKEDLVCCKQQTWVVEISDGTGGSARHEVPVYLREEQVRILDPDLGDPLAAHAVLDVPGQAGDGRVEAFPLVLRLDYLDEDALDGYAVDILVGGQSVTLTADDLTRLDEGSYRYEAPIDLYDFPDGEEDVGVSAELRRSGEVVGSFEADPVTLRLDGSANGCTFEFTYAGTGTRGDWSGRIEGDASFSTGELDQDPTGRTVGAMQVLTYDDTGRRTADVQLVLLTDQDPIFAQVGFGGDSGGTGIPLGRTGVFHVPGGAGLSGDADHGFDFSDVSYAVDITTNDVEEVDGVARLTALAGSFEAELPVVWDNPFPEDGGNAQLTVLRGSFSFDRAVCPSNLS